MDELSLENDGYAIPFNEVQRLIDLFPFGHKFRVAFEMIALIGCRISELDNIGANSIQGNIIIWKTGKNQTGYRKEWLPDWYLLEIEKYKENYPYTKKRLFRFNAIYLRDVLNKQVRPNLGGNWLIKEPKPTKTGAIKKEHIYRLKGLRHNFATLDFYNNFIKWGGTVAVEFTCKRMKHSSYKMTAGHYIGNFERLNIKKYCGQPIHKIIKNTVQKRIVEYF